MIRVLVAEDSQTVKELLVSILESDPDIHVVGHARNGAEAVELARRLRPDLITMDIHMPVMDGVEATKEIMAHTPTPIIIVASSQSSRDVDRSFHAMRAGALMLVPKPDDPTAPHFDGRRARFLAMVKAMAEVKVVRRWAQATYHRPPTAPPPPGGPVEVVAVAASTGGPAALQRVLGDLPRDFAAPILVVQHIAEGFAGGLADWLADACNLRVKLAEAGEALLPRTVYLAPTGVHLGVTADGRVALDRGPAIEGHRPSATHLFRSLARVYGSELIVVMLTGMGRDGVAGLKDVRQAGGRVLAQDEETSVVYGMPRAAVEEGLVDAVLAVQQIGPAVVDLIRRADADTRSDR